MASLVPRTRVPSRYHVLLSAWGETKTSQAPGCSLKAALKDHCRTLLMSLYSSSCFRLCDVRASGLFWRLKSRKAADFLVLGLFTPSPPFLLLLLLSERLLRTVFMFVYPIERCALNRVYQHKVSLREMSENVHVITK